MVPAAAATAMAAEAHHADTRIIGTAAADETPLQTVHT